MDTWLSDLIPEELQTRGAEVGFCAWLRAAPIDPADRKLVLVDWCDFVGEPLTAGLVELSGAR